MTTPHWQLQTPIHAIVFDCDGTLSTIEGVNELARLNGVYSAVEALTTEAMSVSGINPQLYQKRLQLIGPNREQVIHLGEQYYVNRVPDVIDVIRLLHRLNKSVYLVSAGLNPAVILFGERLGVKREHIFAVDMQFDANGQYLSYDQTSPLIHNHGKKLIVSQIKTVFTEILHIGDGLNDFSTQDIVRRFVGYGGVYYREQMKKNCQYYIETLGLSAMLPLCLTADEVERLTADEKKLYQDGLWSIEAGKVKV